MSKEVREYTPEEKDCSIIECNGSSKCLLQMGYSKRELKILS